MDGLRDFLDTVRRSGHAQGNFLGLLHVLVGRTILRTDGRMLSAGLTWRLVAAWLKRVRWPREAVRELGLDPDKLPPRERERFWYVAIARAHLDSAEAARAGDRLAQAVAGNGYVVGPPPH